LLRFAGQDHQLAKRRFCLKTPAAKTVPSTGNKRGNTNASSEVLAMVPFVIGNAESGIGGPLASIGLSFPVI
jgi:hypothetical protein